MTTTTTITTTALEAWERSLRLSPSEEAHARTRVVGYDLGRYRPDATLGAMSPDGEVYCRACAPGIFGDSWNEDVDVISITADGEYDSPLTCDHCGDGIEVALSEEGSRRLALEWLAEPPSGWPAILDVFIHRSQVLDDVANALFDGDDEIEAALWAWASRHC